MSLFKIYIFNSQVVDRISYGVDPRFRGWSEFTF